MATSSKVRSPNYPSLSLREAVHRVDGIYKREYTNYVPREVAATRLGYGTLNGASASAISALVKYGLLEQGKGREQVRVTQRALEIILTKPGNPDRIAAIQEAALEPPLFTDLHEQFGERPPSDENLRLQLIRRGFNPRSVGDVIRAYRDTMAFVDEEGASLSTPDEDVDEAEDEAPMETPRTSAEPAYPKAQLRFPVAERFPVADDPDTKTLAFPIGNDLQVFTAFKGQVTDESLDAYIQILRLTLGMPERKGQNGEPHLAVRTMQPMLESGHGDGQEEA